MGEVIYMSGQCSIDGCSAQVHARSYCRSHYQRLRKAGALRMNTEVIAARGRRDDHQHYMRWCKLRSARALCAEWGDFWVFADGIGDPNGCSKILRLDRSRPYGPDNFRWAEKLTGERKNAYYREWYKNNPSQRDQRYRKQYGIGIGEYEALLAKQRGVCAICGGNGNGVVRKGINEDQRRLNVDHCHEDGTIRGLLCSPCNTAIGLLGHNSALLFAAIQYLTAGKPVGKVS